MRSNFTNTIWIGWDSDDVETWIKFLNLLEKMLMMLSYFVWLVQNMLDQDFKTPLKLKDTFNLYNLLLTC